jgi:phage tail-like protein
VKLLDNFRFWVVVDELPSVDPGLLLPPAGIITGRGPAAGLQEVTGLGAEMEVVPYPEGGFNTFVHQLPGRHSYPRIVLKRGIVREKLLWDWYRAGLVGTLGARRGGIITLLDPTGEPALSWGFVGGLAVKWSGPGLNAMQNEVAVESLEIAHQGLIPL